MVTNLIKSSLLVSILIAGCQKPAAPPVPTDVQAFQKPTATEIFNLRSTCAGLGEKVLRENIIGISLTQDEVSHYDPKTNRCYVELTVQDAEIGKGDYFSQYLFDGQTDDMLATIRIDKRGKWGTVYDDQHNSPITVKDGVVLPGDIAFSDTAEYIQQKMEDDRKQ